MSSNGPVVLEEMFENVDGQPDAGPLDTRVIGTLLTHPLALGSCVKIKSNSVSESLLLGCNRLKENVKFD